MTTLFRDRRPASTDARRPVTRGPLAATVLADALWRATAGQPLPPELHAHPRPTMRADGARDGLEAIIRGPSAVSFR